MAYQKTTSSDPLKQNLKTTLLEMLHIDGVHPNDSEIAAYVSGRLDNAGVSYQRDSYGNFIIKIPGSTDKPIMLSTHIDIPETIPNFGYIEGGDIIKSDGNGILGVDPKTGLAILVQYACDIANGNVPPNASPLEIVLTRGEEKGLLGARNLDRSLVSAQVGIVLDEDGPVTSVVTGSSSACYMKVVYTGTPVHPREPELGSNALQAVNEALNNLPWGFTKNGVMWNVGRVTAGTARNTMPGTAELHAELRTMGDHEVLMADAHEIKVIFKAAGAKHGVECDVELSVAEANYTHRPDAPILQLMEQTFAKIDKTPNYYTTLGRSDANVFNSYGVSTVAMGSGYYNAHQYTEYADLGDMVDIYNFLVKFDANYAEQAELKDS